MLYDTRAGRTLNILPPGPNFGGWWGWVGERGVAYFDKRTGKFRIVSTGTGKETGNVFVPGGGVNYTVDSDRAYLVFEAGDYIGIVGADGKPSRILFRRLPTALPCPPPS